MAIHYSSSAPTGWGVDDAGHFAPVPTGYVNVGGTFQPPQAQQASSASGIPAGYEKIPPGTSTDVINKKYGSNMKAIAEGGIMVTYGLPDPQFNIKYNPDGSSRNTHTYPDGSMVDLTSGQVLKQPTNMSPITGNTAPTPLQDLPAGSAAGAYRYDSVAGGWVPNTPAGTLSPGIATIATPPPVQPPPVQQQSQTQPQTPVVPQQNMAGAFTQDTSLTGIHLVKFSSMPAGSPAGENATTVFYVDKANGSLRPFMSADAFNNFYGASAAEAWNSIYTASPADLEGTGPLAGLYVLNQDYGIQPDGKMSNPNFSPAAVSGRYGKPYDDTVIEAAVGQLEAIKMQMDGLISDGTLKGITKDNLLAVLSDPVAQARLISAIGYGGYDAKDITMEVTRLALVKGGNTELAGTSVINDTKNKQTYSATSEYKTATQNPNIALPQSAAERIMSQSTSPDYFSNPQGALVDFMKDPDVKNKMDQMLSTYSDILMQGLTADTEQAHQIAQSNWDSFKKTVESNLGIVLAGSAIDAWDQVSNLGKQASGQGMLGSGVHNEIIDKYLKGVRTADQVKRNASLTDEEQKKSSFYQSSASPVQIQQLIAEDQASGKPKEEWQSVKFGLVPSDEMKGQFDVATLFAKLKQDYSMKNFPDWYIQQKAQDLHDAALDENGNRRSTLYMNLMTKQQEAAMQERADKMTQLQKEAIQKNEQIFSGFQEPDPNGVDAYSQQTSADLAAQRAAFPTDGSGVVPPGGASGVGTGSSTPVVPPGGTPSTGTATGAPVAPKPTTTTTPASTATATMYNPTTKQIKVITGGDPTAYSGGFQLMPKDFNWQSQGYKNITAAPLPPSSTTLTAPNPAVKAAADKAAAEAAKKAAAAISGSLSGISKPPAVSTGNLQIKDETGNVMSVSQNAWNDIYSKQNGRYTMFGNQI